MDEQNKAPLGETPVQNQADETAAAPKARTLNRKPASAAGQNRPVRRVGSLSLGVCLIAAGIFFLCYFFVPDFNWQLALKIAPAAGLILLGCEVLFFAARPGRWKYDFMSVFVCLILMAGCFCLSFVPVLWSQIDPARQQTAAKLGKTYTAEVYAALREDVPEIRLQDVYASLYLYTNTVEDLKDLEPGDGNLSLAVTLFGPYTSAEDFAKDCRAVTDVIQKQAVQPDSVTFQCGTSYSDSETRQALDSGSMWQTRDYRLELYGVAQMDWTAEQMLQETTGDDLLDEENEQEESASESAADAEA